MEPIRTSDIMTAGITNVPLSYPARLFFIHDLNSENVETTYNVLESYKVNFERTDIINTGKAFISTIKPVEPKVIKQIFRNFRNLKPKIDSDYRYPFWEIDTIEDNVFNEIIGVYNFLALPVYAHRSTHGWHFMCVKPIPKEKWQWFIRQVRHTNDKYPPITLRITPNKYVGEKELFFNGLIINPNDKYHSDTAKLKDMIEKQDLIGLQQQYQIVWYRFEDRQEASIQ